MRKLLFIATVFITSFSFSQSKEFKVTGKLIGSDDQAPLEAATIYMQRVKDSALVTYTISDKHGAFSLEDTTADEYLNLYISYVGYKTYFQKIKIDKPVYDLETIPLEINSSSLDEVVIKSVAPVTIKKDTLEFNVKSFKTKKDANVEDLLKKLPGVEIDEEGKITVNGKEVNKILVNGKPFFGNDPSITTKNLTKDIIEKIQIVDTKSKSDAFAGKKSSGENKTINLTIKEENNKGVFGRLSAGGGTDERYELAGMVNIFDNDQRVSVLAGGNNTNSPGFSFGEISKMFGPGGNRSFNSNGSFSIDGRSFGGGQGVTTSQIAGANYADKYGELLDVSGDYFYSGSNSDNKSTTRTETILSDSRFFSNSNSSSINDTDNHSINTDFEIEIDSTFLIHVKPSFSFTKSKTAFSSQNETLNEALVLTNQSTRQSVVDNIAKNFKNNLSLTKRFGNKGAYLKFGLNTSFRDSEGEDFLNSNTQIFGDTPETINRDQFTDEEGDNTTFSADINYRVPLKAKEIFLDFEYAYARSKDLNRKSTFNLDNTTQEYTLFDEDLSTDFQYTDREHSPGISLSVQKEKWHTSFGVNYISRTLGNEDVLRPQFNIERDFKAIELDYNFNYRFSPKMSIYASYNLRNEPPRLGQLQAFEDVSNPLNTIVGNPNLEPENSHDFYLNFNNYDWQKRTGFYLYASGAFTNNNVVSKTAVDAETLQRETTYANVNGNYRLNGGFSYNKSFKVDSVRSIRTRIGLWTNTSKNINFNNNVQYASNVRSLSPNVFCKAFCWN